MTKRDYLDLFQGEGPEPDSKLVRALERAHDIRKFEIELYWKRAAYFWIFIATLFAGFGALFPFEAPAKFTLPRALALYAVGLMGFGASLCWYFVNRGSKYWQENWEAHVDALEDAVEGPIYKTVLKTPQNFAEFRKFLGAYRFSVSKINLAISLSVTGLWLLILLSLPFAQKHPFRDAYGYYLTGVAVVVSLVGGCLLFFRVRTEDPTKRKRHEFSIRNIQIDQVDDPRG